MIAVKLTNNFHGTAVTLHFSKAYPTAAQVRRAQRELCGFAGCMCSCVMGMIAHEKVKLPAHLYGDLAAAVSIYQQQNILKVIDGIMKGHHFADKL
jgi:hypothetical protein